MLCAGAVVQNIDLCFLVLCLRLDFVECSTLGTYGVDKVVNCGFVCVIYPVFRMLLLLLYCITLELAGSHIVVVSVVAIYVLCCIAHSVI